MHMSSAPFSQSHTHIGLRRSLQTSCWFLCRFIECSLNGFTSRSLFTCICHFLSFTSFTLDLRLSLVITFSSLFCLFTLLSCFSLFFEIFFPTPHSAIVTHPCWVSTTFVFLSLLHHFSSAFDLYLSFPLLSFSFFSLFLDKKQQVKVKDVNSNTTRYAKKTLSTLRFFYFYLKHFGGFLFFYLLFFLQWLLLSKCSLMYLCCYSFTSFLLMLYSHAAGIYLSTAIKTFYTDFCGTINFVQMSYFHCFMQAEKYVCLCVCVCFFKEEL